MIEICLFLAVGIAAPFIKNQLITGTLVNALFYLSVMKLGFSRVFLLGAMPSLMALFSGLLVPLFYPFIPFIMLANGIQMFLFARIYRRGFWRAVIFSGSIKSLFLFLMSFFFFSSVYENKELLSLITFPFGIGQWLTAIGGGLLLFFLRKDLFSK